MLLYLFLSVQGSSVQALLHYARGQILRRVSFPQLPVKGKAKCAGFCFVANFREYLGNASFQFPVHVAKQARLSQIWPHWSVQEKVKGPPKTFEHPHEPHRASIVLPVHSSSSPTSNSIWGTSPLQTHLSPEMQGISQALFLHYNRCKLMFCLCLPG